MEARLLSIAIATLLVNSTPKQKNVLLLAVGLTVSGIAVYRLLSK